MKQTLIAIAFVLAVAATANAASMLFFFVGSGGSGGGGGGGGCNGTLDLSTGCPQPMLGVM